MGIYCTPWKAFPMLKRNGDSDRLKRFHVLGSNPGRGKPIIADKIRTKEQADVIAAAPELLKALEDMVEYSFYNESWQDRNKHVVENAQTIINKAKGLTT